MGPLALAPLEAADQDSFYLLLALPQAVLENTQGVTAISDTAQIIQGTNRRETLQGAKFFFFLKTSKTRSCWSSEGPEAAAGRYAHVDYWISGLIACDTARQTVSGCFGHMCRIPLAYLWRGGGGG